MVVITCAILLGVRIFYQVSKFLLSLQLLLVHSISQVVYNLFFSPLSKIPGPFVAKITTKWLTFIDLTGRRTTVLHQLHQRYGTAIRIAPNEISFSDRGSIKELYGQQTTFLKAPIYDTMSVPPFGIFSMRDRADHSQRRRLLSHAFAQSSLYESEPLIKDNIRALLSRLDSEMQKPVDVMALFRLLAFDIVGKSLHRPSKFPSTF